MDGSAMSEIFYKEIERLIHLHSHLIENFKASRMGPRAERCAKAIHDHRTRLENCIGLVECTRIEMCQAGWLGNSEKVKVLG